MIWCQTSQPGVDPDPSLHVVLQPNVKMKITTSRWRRRYRTRWGLALVHGRDGRECEPPFCITFFFLCCTLLNPHFPCPDLVSYHLCVFCRMKTMSTFWPKCQTFCTLYSAVTRRKCCPGLSSCYSSLSTLLWVLWADSRMVNPNGYSVSFNLLTSFCVKWGSVYPMDYYEIYFGVWSTAPHTKFPTR